MTDENKDPIEQKRTLMTRITAALGRVATPAAKLTQWSVAGLTIFELFSLWQGNPAALAGLGPVVGMLFETLKGEVLGGLLGKVADAGEGVTDEQIAEWVAEALQTAGVNDVVQSEAFEGLIGQLEEQATAEHDALAGLIDRLQIVMSGQNVKLERQLKQISKSLDTIRGDNYEIKGDYVGGDKFGGDKLTADHILQDSEFKIGKVGKKAAVAQGPDAKAISGDGVIAEDGAIVVKLENVGDNANIQIVAGKDGWQERDLEDPGDMSAVEKGSLEERYLAYVIQHNRYLRLQGIRSGGRNVHIELDQIYVTLRMQTKQERPAENQRSWLGMEAELGPGVRGRMGRIENLTETATVSVNKALEDHKRLVVLGDPGSGKTTLLRYLTLIYGRDFSSDTGLVQARLGLDERGVLPILIELRDFGKFIKTHHAQDDGTEGYTLLLDLYLSQLKGEGIDLPKSFLEGYLGNGKAIVLLDGLDEVASGPMRQRVSELVESFTLRFTDCRYVLSSRVAGYEGVEVGIDYHTATVRQFTLADVRHFLTEWHRVIVGGQASEGGVADHKAKEQTDKLMGAIEAKAQIQDLAINPLMLTVIALVHKDQVKLPDRRAELYAEAVDVLLGKWDEAKGLPTDDNFGGRQMDTTDKRLMLQTVALHMMESERRDIDKEVLLELLLSEMSDLLGQVDDADQLAERFVGMIEERAGLLIEREKGVFAFSHLTFQEYLAAAAIAAREDYIGYTLKVSGEAWWKETILLEAGFLSLQGRDRANRLIQAISEHEDKHEKFHNLVLAANCLNDVGEGRVSAKIAGVIQRKLRDGVEAPPPWEQRWFRKKEREGDVEGWIKLRAKAMEALAQSGAGYWSGVFGEPEWVMVGGGESQVTVYDDENKYFSEKRKTVVLPDFKISRVPITNAQFELFITDTGYKAPRFWEDDKPLKGKESHPVVGISWFDAVVYCEWLSGKLGKEVRLPTHAEWQKAAGWDEKAQKLREYAWGETFEKTRCNTEELGVQDTTPVGVFPEGASPYGCLDIAGNVWEWLSDEIEDNYPLVNENGQFVDKEGNQVSEQEDWVWEVQSVRVLAGGSWHDNQSSARVSYRYWDLPHLGFNNVGFRVVSPVS